MMTEYVKLKSVAGFDSFVDSVILYFVKHPCLDFFFLVNLYFYKTSAKGFDFPPWTLNTMIHAQHAVFGYHLMSLLTA